MTYQPITDPNTPPQYGQSGDSVKTLQNNLNTQNANTPGYVPLVPDGLYGPKTQAAYNASLGKSQLIVDSTKAKTDYATAGNYLDQHIQSANPNVAPVKSAQTDGAYTDAYTQALDALGSRSDMATKSLIATISAQHANAVNNINQNYDKYSRGMELLGIENNSAQSGPEALAGQLLEIKNQQMSKISALDVEMNKAVLDAQNARADNDFKIVKEKVDYIKQLKKDKADAIKELATSEDQYMQKATFYGKYIYDALQGIPASQRKDAIDALSKSLGIPSAYIIGAASKAAPAPKKASGSGTGSSSSLKADTAYLDNRWKIGNKDPQSGALIRGTDGFLDPQEYISALNQWKHGEKAFLAKYPVKSYINPTSYSLLPTSIKPKKTRTS